MPLEQVLHIPSVRDAVGFATLNLLKSCVTYCSKASTFYHYLLCSAENVSSNLVQRARSFANSINVNLYSFIFNNDYANRCAKRKYFPMDCDNGLNDSICTLLSDYHASGARELLQLLVTSF